VVCGVVFSLFDKLLFPETAAKSKKEAKCVKGRAGRIPGEQGGGGGERKNQGCAGLKRTWGPRNKPFLLEAIK